MHTRITYLLAGNRKSRALSSFWLVGRTTCRYGDNGNHYVFFGGRSQFSKEKTGWDDPRIGIDNRILGVQDFIAARIGLNKWIFFIKFCYNCQQKSVISGFSKAISKKFRLVQTNTILILPNNPEQIECQLPRLLTIDVLETNMCLLLFRKIYFWQTPTTVHYCAARRQMCGTGVNFIDRI